MCIQKCCKKEFVPRKKRVGSYKLVNSYTQPPSLEQIITIIIFAIQLTLHSVFIVPPLDDIQKQILWVLLGFHYTLLIIIGYDYIQLTTNDPVDRLVLHSQVPQHVRQQQLVLCILCDSHVRGTSHHCYRCDRCTEQFDHHCKFLNNCIGGQNYQYFFRLLSIYTLYNFNIIGQSIWVMQRSFSSPQIAMQGNQWGAIALLVLTLLIIVAVGGLLGFHCYISICEMTTTLQYNYPQKRKKPMSSGGPMTNVNIFQPPASAQRISSHNQGKVI